MARMTSTTMAKYQYIYHMSGLTKAFSGGKKILEDIHLQFYPDAKIGVVLNYPVTWSAPHIAGHGKKTWAEVATFNPVAKPESGKE